MALKTLRMNHMIDPYYLDMPEPGRDDLEKYLEGKLASVIRAEGLCPLLSTFRISWTEPFTPEGVEGDEAFSAYYRPVKVAECAMDAHDDHDGRAAGPSICQTVGCRAIAPPGRPKCISCEVVAPVSGRVRDLLKPANAD